MVLILGMFLDLILGRFLGGLARAGLAVPALAWLGLACLRLGLVRLGLAWAWGWFGNDLVWLEPALYLNRTGPILYLRWIKHDLVWNCMGPVLVLYCTCFEPNWSFLKLCCCKIANQTN